MPKYKTLAELVMPLTEEMLKTPPPPKKATYDPSTGHTWAYSSGTTHTCVKCSCVRFTVDKRGESDSRGGFYSYHLDNDFRRSTKKAPSCKRNRPWPPATR